MSEVQADKEKEGTLSTILKIVKIAFLIVITFVSIYGLYLNYTQNDLIFRPVLGVTDIKLIRALKDVDVDTYEGTDFAVLEFKIKNVGSLPAKHYKSRIKAKIGDTVLPYKEKPAEQEGYVVIPEQAMTYRRGIEKKYLDKLINTDDRLVYEINVSFTDWQEGREYDYPFFIEVYVPNKEKILRDKKVALQLLSRWVSGFEGQ